MGQSQAAEVREFQHNYEYQYSGVDPDYGQISVYNKRISHELYAVVKRPLNKEDDIVKRMQIIKQRSVLYHPNCIHVVGSHYQPAFDFCGEVNMLYMLIEYIPNNILKDIHYRRQKKFIYTEAEVWYFIKSVVDALTFYNKQGIEHFDLHPSNVRLNDNGIVKLMDLSLHEQPLPSTMKIQLGLRPFEYLAPEQILSLNGKAQLNQEKINIYCLGVMCIQLILRIENCIDLFQGNKFTYSQERLHQYYSKQSFSLALQNIINEMIREQPSERLSYSDVLNFISLQTTTAIQNHLRPTTYQAESSQTSRIENTRADISKMDASRLDMTKNSQISQQQNSNEGKGNRLILNSVDPSQSFLYPIQEIKTPVQDIRSVLKPQLISSEPKSQDAKSSPGNRIFQSIQPSPTQRDNAKKFNLIPPQLPTTQTNVDFTEIDLLINKALQKSHDAFSRFGSEVSQNSLPNSIVIDSPSKQQNTAQFYSAQKYLPLHSHQLSQIQMVQASKNSSIIQPLQNSQLPNTIDQSTIMHSRIKDAIQEAEAELEKSKMLSDQLKLTVN